MPNGPSHTKNTAVSRKTTGSKFGTGRTFGKVVAKHYGEFSEMLALSRKKGCQIVNKGPPSKHKSNPELAV